MTTESKPYINTLGDKKNLIFPINTTIKSYLFSLFSLIPSMNDLNTNTNKLDFSSSEDFKTEISQLYKTVEFNNDPKVIAEIQSILNEWSNVKVYPIYNPETWIKFKITLGKKNYYLNLLDNSDKSGKAVSYLGNSKIIHDIGTTEYLSSYLQGIEDNKQSRTGEIKDIGVLDDIKSNLFKMIPRA